jgi:enoyl-CoA hydratase/carnithine racemase
LTEFAGIISQLEQERERIDRALAALRDISDAPQTAAASVKRRGRPPASKSTGKRHMSAETRRRMAEGQQRRWANKRAADAATTKKGKKSRG